MLVNFENDPKRYQDPVLWAWLEIFSPFRGTSSKKKHFVWLNTSKGAPKAPTVDLLRLKTLRGTITVL